MQNFLEADSIRKSFGDKQVLTDIYVGCKTGDIIGLLGRNGIGKSTFLKILFGSLHTDHKHIAINGEHVIQPFKKEGAVGYLNQDNFLPKSFTVKNILKMFDDEVDEPAFHADELISKILNTRIGELSGGESRYLEVRLILSLKKQFVLLDEPFNGISPIHIDSIKEMIRKQSAKKGIILTDHDYHNVLDVANKYMLLFDGGIKILKSKEEFVYWGYLPENSRS